MPWPDSVYALAPIHANGSHSHPHGFNYREDILKEQVRHLRCFSESDDLKEEDAALPTKSKAPAFRVGLQACDHKLCAMMHDEFVLKLILYEHWSQHALWANSPMNKWLQAA
jgi:hypothetical protein